MAVRPWLVLVLEAAALAAVLEARAQALTPEAAGPAVALLFSIAKSENKNQVQYAVRVDSRCAPAGDAPVFAYWRMLERGPTRTEPLLAHEIPAYGIAFQRVISRDSPRGQVRFTLHAVPEREIFVETWRDDSGACRAWSTVTIQDTPAHLFNVYVRLAWPLAHVEYLLLQGWSLDGTHIITEKLKR